MMRRLFNFEQRCLLTPVVACRRRDVRGWSTAIAVLQHFLRSSSNDATHNCFVRLRGGMIGRPPLHIHTLFVQLHFRFHRLLCDAIVNAHPTLQNSPLPNIQLFVNNGDRRCARVSGCG